MPKHHSQRYVSMIVKEIDDGASIHDIKQKYAIPESTLYRWLSEYREHRTEYGKFTVRKYSESERRCEDYKKMLAIVVGSPFIQDIPVTTRESYMKGLQNRCKYPSHILCGAFGVDHATFHRFLYVNKGNRAWFVERRRRLERLITKIFFESGKSYGAKKIRAVLRTKNHEKVSLEYVREIMRDLGLRGASPKRRKRDTNLSYMMNREKENLLKQDFQASTPNQKWVLDSKMFYCKDKRIEICVIVDLFSRRVIAYRLGSKECGRLVCGTLNDAFSSRKPAAGLIVHSDGSMTNRGLRVNRIITKHKSKHSYSRSHNPFDNASVESFFSRFTAEFLYDAYEVHPFASVKEMRTRLEKYVHDYNYIRPHGYNDGLSPVAKEKEYFSERQKNEKILICNRGGSGNMSGSFPLFFAYR